MGRPASSGLDGILLVDKPAGWTSHDVVARVRRLTGQRRAGHTGTLDPAATGLLVICLGRATRLVEYMGAHGKSYIGRVQLGVTTDTDDAEGTVIGERPLPPDWQGRLEEICARFVGDISQRPPAYSALKVDGQRAYARARAGETVELAERPVTVRRLAVGCDRPDGFVIEVDCGPGTYIRSLARDIGAALGCGAHLAALRRTASGPFSLDDAWTLDQLSALADDGRIAEAVLPPDEGITRFPAALLGLEHAAMTTHGRAFPAADTRARPTGAARMYDADGRFLGVANVGEGGQIRPLKVIFGL